MSSVPEHQPLSCDSAATAPIPPGPRERAGDDAAPLGLRPRALWVTWEHQRRNAGIAAALGVPLLEIDLKCSPLERYARSLWRTWRAYARERPSVIFVQNPSLVLALSSVFWGLLTKARIVVDAHNAAILPLSAPRWSLWRLLSRTAARGAHLTLVSNSQLTQDVERYGGRCFVLPDRIPTFPSAQMALRTSGPTVMFICTFADDEPYLELIEAARQIDSTITVFITGNPRHRAGALKAAAPANVAFTGFLPEDDYIRLLQSADVVIDLTTRENCLVCGAYEAVAAGRAMILSGNVASRAYFRDSAVYTDNTAADIAAAIREALVRAGALRESTARLKQTLQDDWNARLLALTSILNADTTQQGPLP